MLRNEAAFSTAITKVLKEKKWFVQRIESGTTGRGIPDLYAVSPRGEAIWIELKRIHMRIYRNRPSYINVTWRPGQQNWLNRVHRYNQKAMTIIAFDDCIGVVQAGARYEKNTVPTSCIAFYKDIRELVGT